MNGLIEEIRRWLEGITPQPVPVPVKVKR